MAGLFLFALICETIESFRSHNRGQLKLRHKSDAVLGHARPGEGLSRAGPSEEQRIEAVKAITLRLN